ncbi:unnamed protein product [Ambrosiozyma monospora]|uniref:Unnamed protein product n=1 Tax=Ambrosiozyma monospora TaxID=43982 RepID=A0A9W6Z405_AMBMO|nr:unnamed protein product [Ambrosiozyma monospora]
MTLHKFPHPPKHIPLNHKRRVVPVDKKRSPASSVDGWLLDINPEEEILKIYDLRKKNNEKNESHHNTYFGILTTPPSKLPHLIHFVNVYIQLGPIRENEDGSVYSKVIIYDESLQHVGFKATLLEQGLLTKPSSNYKFSGFAPEDKSKYSEYPFKVNKILKRIRWDITVKHEISRLHPDTHNKTIIEMNPHSYILYKEMAPMIRV